MELTIGIRDAAAPLTIETELNYEELKAKISDTLASSKYLEITGADGSTTIIPGAAIGYIRVAKEEQRRVGFGFI
ncbi:DUF3107 domain-containing protein [Arcanobacterium hippocoleae]|uniref:DUF3107 domain-containing protein n=1 Tax=Arcanobacterium hippocoleae TaxID=149017 RepID=A0ABU1T1C9_9ACTO|nr:DUF3107 domain-containing protein [Arcanobacterium hippocoleae]MDR6938656.1 hypothetical protein [Arcanobacterium hippocoleae]